MLRIKTRDFKKKGIATFLTDVGSIILAMKSNPIFPNPSPPIADLENQLNILKQKTILAGGGEKVLINERNLQRSLVYEMVLQEAAYVLSVCSGTPNKEAAIAQIESSGFKVIERSTGIKPAAAVVQLQATTSELPGTVYLKWKSIPGVFFLIETTGYSPANERAAWTPAGLTTRSKITVKGLPSLSYCWFRVIAVYSGGRKSAPSNPVRCLVG